MLTGRIKGIAVAFVLLLGSGCGEIINADFSEGVRGEAPDQGQVGLRFSYPPEWRTTLGEAEESADFVLRVPSHTVANRKNAKAIYMKPEGRAVILEFPAPPGRTSQKVRQPFIEIYQESWQGTQDPEEMWAESVAQYPGAAEVVTVGGVAALVIQPENQFDSEEANPAFVRFVHNGVDVQLSGGDDTGVLKEIAETMV